MGVSYRIFLWYISTTTSMVTTFTFSGRHRQIELSFGIAFILEPSIDTSRVNHNQAETTFILEPSIDTSRVNHIDGPPRLAIK